MKKALLAIQVIFLVFFSITLLATILQLSGPSNPLTRFNYDTHSFNHKEDFDPGFSRLNSIKSLETFCDSLYKQQDNWSAFPEKTYTDLVSAVIRKRFYHGYSHYGSGDNYVALLASRVTVEGYSAIVIPDDILKYPYAACSQQSIVMMELLKRKGFKTRKIVFQGKMTGHFSFEVYYGGSWHFYDTNMEPDVQVLNAHNRPGIDYLVQHPDILLNAYRQYPQQEIMDVFPTYTYGAINTFPAPRALVFQKVTKFLSYTLWLFFGLAFLITRRVYARITRKNYVRNRRIYFPQPQAGTSSAYYPGITAPGS